MKIFAVYSIKGGVGKTASAVNLAFLSSLAGARTLLWDLDPQGAASFYFRVEPTVAGGGKELVRGADFEPRLRGTDYEGLDLLPADFSYRHLDLDLDATKKPTKRLARLLQPLADRYDHLYLDCAPSISLVSESVFVAADALLVPTIPTPLSLRTLEQLRRHLDGRRRAPQLLPFFCMVDRRKTLHRETAAAAGDPASGFLASSVPYASLVERMGTHRAPVAVYAPGSPPAQAYERLWREVMERTVPV